MEYFEYWIPTLRQMYKVCTLKEKRELKKYVYKNWNLTEDQKDQVWIKIAN